jgi:hypothetical protein
VGWFDGLGFDPDSDTLYGVQNQEIYAIDTVEGTATAVGSTAYLVPSALGNPLTVIPRGYVMHDCNGNGIPDDCDTDCNGNGIIDDCDIAATPECEACYPAVAGLSEDCDGNGVPDECTFSPDTDCDANGILDACELIDCNNNGTHDVCELGALLYVEEFDGDALPGGNWGVEFVNATGYTGGEISGALQVNDIEYVVLEEWAEVVFSTAVPSTEDFAISTTISWDAEGLLAAMDGVRLIARGGETVHADVAFQDGWLGSAGQVSFHGGGQASATGPDSMPLAGSAVFTIIRQAGVLTFLHDGEIAASGTSSGPVDNLQIRFFYYPYDGPPPSFVGTLRVEYVRISVPTATDCNANSVPDLCENLPNCDGDAESDQCEIILGTSDCDGNSVPDDCQPDCNADGIIDDCDVDCNTNGQSDICEILDGTPDCNGNNAPDECDILEGIENDDNGNGIPDSCESGCPVLAVAEGCRAFSVVPDEVPECDISNPVAIEITSPDYPCVLKYVQIDGTLGDVPWYLPGNTWGTVTVVGDVVLPETAYAARLLYDTGGASDLAPVQTWIWGDVDNNSVANFADILLTVQRFQGNMDVSLAASDLWPCHPDGLVNFSDIQQDVFAFQSQDINCIVECP